MRILKSSIRNHTYHARWYRRHGRKEDPWISLENHGKEIVLPRLPGDHHPETHELKKSLDPEESKENSYFNPDKNHIKGPIILLLRNAGVGLGGSSFALRYIRSP